ILHGKNARFWLAAVRIVLLRKGAGKLKRPLPSLSPAVAKKRAVESGDLRQHLREFRLILVEEEIRNVNQPPCLTLDRRLDCRVIVAERIDSNSTQEIQVSLALGVPEIHAAPANKKYRLALVGRKQKLRFHAGDRSETHALSTSVPHSSLVK